MVRIDWGEVEPSDRERRYVEAQIAAWKHVEGPTITIGQRAGDDFEARMRVTPKQHATEVRLHGDDLCGLVDRLLGLLAIAMGERRDARAERHPGACRTKGPRRG